MRQYIKVIGKHSSIYTVSNILTKAIGIILIPIYSRYLTTSDYGIISLINPLVAGMSVLFTFGMRGTLGRFYFDYEENSPDQKKLIGNIVIFLFVLGLFLGAIFMFPFKSLLIKLFPGVPYNPFIMLAIISSYAMVFFQLKLNLFRIRQQSLKYGVLSFIQFVGTLVLTIVLIVVFSKGAIGKVFSESLMLSVLFIYIIISLRKEIILNFDLKLLKNLLKYALPLIPHSFAGVITGIAGKMILNYYEGLSLTGIYNIALLLGSIMGMIVTSVNLSWNPFFIKMAKEKGEGAKPIFSQLTTYYVMAIMFIGLVIVVFSKEIVLVLTLKNPEYLVAYKIVPIIILNFIVIGFYYMASNNVFYIKKAVKYIPISTISAAIINVLLNIVLVKRFSLYGVAWAQFGGNLILFAITFVIAQKFFRIKYEYVRILKILVYAGIVVALHYFLISFTNFNIILLLIVKLALLLFFVSLLFLTKLIRPSEIQNLKNILLKLKNRYI